MSTTPPAPPTKTPASAPIGAALAGAAVLAMQAIAPMANGTTPNWALLAATFIVVFLATLGTALFHLQLPSAIQQAAITEVAAGIAAGMTAVAAHTHTAITVPVPTPVAPAPVAPAPVATPAPAPVAPAPAPTVEVNVTPPAAPTPAENLPPAGTPPPSPTPEPAAPAATPAQP